MKRRKIVLICDKDECYDSATGEAVPFYVYNEAGWHKPEVIIAYDADDATLEQLANLCDQDAESDNYHSFVGAHKRLGILLLERLSRASATDIMRDIAYTGGLHNMGQR